MLAWWKKRILNLFKRIIFQMNRSLKAQASSYCAFQKGIASFCNHCILLPSSRTSTVEYRRSSFCWSNSSFIFWMSVSKVYCVFVILCETTNQHFKCKWIYNSSNLLYGCPRFRFKFLIFLPCNIHTSNESWYIICMPLM